MLGAKMQEPYSIKILNDLATVAIAMQGFAEAVRPLPCLVLLNIYCDAALIIIVQQHDPGQYNHSAL